MSAPIAIEGRPGINSMTLEFVCLLPLDHMELDVYGLDGLQVTSPVPAVLPPCRQCERIPVPVRWERGDGKGMLVVHAAVSGPGYGIASHRGIEMDRRQLTKAVIPYVVLGLLAITSLGLAAAGVRFARRRLRHATESADVVRPLARRLRIAAIAWLAIVVPLCAGMSWYAAR